MDSEKITQNENILFYFAKYHHRFHNVMHHNHLGDIGNIIFYSNHEQW